MLNLTRFRLAKRWSRAELARRARIAAGDLGKIESGRLQPYDSQLRKLAHALGIPSDAPHPPSSPTPRRPKRRPEQAARRPLQGTHGGHARR